jgi:hypothetical protein
MQIMDGWESPTFGWLQLTGLNVMRSYPARAQGEQEEF